MEDDFAPIEHNGCGQTIGPVPTSVMYGPGFLPTQTDQLCSIGRDPPSPLSHSTLLNDYGTRY